MTDREPPPPPREVRGEAHLSGEGHMRATGQVRRGVNPLRLAALGFIVATSLGVGALVSWWAGILTFAGLGIIFAIPRTRHLLMEFAHRLTGA